MRDYNKEIINNKRKYAYNFDLDIMHPYMIRAFMPFMKAGNALELGCYQGAFTKRIKPLFNEITCIEASSEAIEIAQKVVKAEYINATFEECKLNKKYKNIFLTHVLEHVDDRVGLLKRINEEWIEEGGVAFIACPNANAPSRQIAVKMGIINYNADITEAEWEHGHRITYSLDTLETDIKKSGLKILHKSGVFFKALANFQWDKLLETDIISDEYLDGCFELGQQYPDLCSTIYFVCTKGKDK